MPISMFSLCNRPTAITPNTRDYLQERERERQNKIFKCTAKGINFSQIICTIWPSNNGNGGPKTPARQSTTQIKNQTRTPAQNLQHRKNSKRKIGSKTRNARPNHTNPQKHHTKTPAQENHQHTKPPARQKHQKRKCATKTPDQSNRVQKHQQTTSKQQTPFKTTSIKKKIKQKSARKKYQTTRTRAT